MCRRQTNRVKAARMPAHLLSHATQSLEAVLESKVPVVISGDYVDPDGTAIVYRSILLPTGREGSRVDSLVGGARCKALKPG